MTNIFSSGIVMHVQRGVRAADIRAGREKLWRERTEDDARIRYADVVAWKPKPNWGEDPSGSYLWRYGFRHAGWWIKPCLEAVVFRPWLVASKDLSREDGGTYIHDYKRGAFLLIWGSSYGVPARRSLLHWTEGMHYTEIISQQKEA